MAQPTWKLLWSTDCTRLLVDATGVYPPELEIADEVFDAPDAERFVVHRVCLERCQAVRPDPGGPVYLVPGAWTPEWAHPLPSYVEWFAKHLGAVASSAGTTEEDIIAGLCSDDPSERASAYQDIIGHFGAHEFDSYPLLLSEEELNKRWSADPS